MQYAIVITVYQIDMPAPDSGAHFGVCSMNVLQFKKKNKENNRNNSYSSESYPKSPQGASAIGIDLGTTNSVVSVFSNGASHPVTLEYENSYLVPSMIFFNKNENENLVGNKAKLQNEITPAEVIKSTKRSMGKNNTLFESNGKQFSAEDAAALVLNYLVSHPILQEEKEKFGGIWAVITVPAHFDDAARLATVAAAEKAGIHVLRIVNEPTAAALAYSMMPEDKKTEKETLAVFDLGGGTFDVSIVDRDGLVFNVLSSEGDVHLGGDDIDEAIANSLIEKVHPQLVARRSSKSSELYRNLIILAERAKKALQSEGLYHVQSNDLDGKGSSIETELSREHFDEMVAPILQRTLFLTESAMHAAKRNPKYISRILLVGGSTRLVLVRKMLSDYFACIVDARLEPDLAVSWGASLQAAIIIGIQPDTILVDVCSHSLGIGVVENTEAINENFKSVAKKFGIPYPISEQELHRKLGARIEDFNNELQKLLHVAPILHRNSALPARRSEFFNTIYHNQHAVHVVVVQGEGDIVGENRLIGSFLFELEQPCPKGTRCEIQLTYDVNGMVHVFARQLGTKNEAKAQFDSRTGEVTGWTSLNLEEEEQFAEKEKLQTVDEIYEKKTSTKQLEKVMSHENIVSFPFGRKNEDIQKAELSEYECEPEIVNALILRAKRYLNKIKKENKEYNLILESLKTYSSLLLKAQQGHENDEEIELVETQLLALLEGK
ncbi:Hsp70 family protein [Fluviispira vulneris]|uniref:Hsp70 family protein n=1 Tax=Fluviispira vulneris TaxID=2763012 RepID=UPI0016456CB4|nr:Hsp70 family protein [Fluviispira vulneris]